MKVILVLIVLGVLVLLAEMFRLKKLLFPLVIIGMLAAIGTAVSYYQYDDGDLTPYLSGMVSGHEVNGKIISTHHIPTSSEYATATSAIQDPNVVSAGSFFTMVQFGDFSMIFSVILLVITLLWFIMAGDFFANETSRSDRYSLVIFSLIGAVVLTCYNNLVMLFLGIEILSIPLYVLAGSRKDDLSSNEAAFKYFLLGAFASAFLLFGITLVYGVTGSFDLPQIQAAVSKGLSNGLLNAGILFILVGLLFKASVAPFHFWAPDVYQGAPTPVTAFMSTVVKTAAFVAILPLFYSVFKGAGDFWIPVVSVCVGLTFIVGNITAVVQNHVKRMLAFSSISHAGFLLLAIAAATNFTPKVIIYYTIAYSIASITAFTVLLNVMKDRGGDTVDAFNGLGKKNPLLAVAMSIALLSLAGIPPTAGFFGKYYVLNAAMQSGQTTLVILGILGSLVGVYYYFRILIAMFLKAPEGDTLLQATPRHQALLFITAVATLVLGLLPDLILNIGAGTHMITP
jgi:NADH-quinone oxidoreductase subunit N